ncbi:MAG: helix-turn-helix transcriptional regulator [Hydrogenophaga sp.]|uniref:Helix-turn-helix transcriptional regulator n=1 Tax=Hydrogenophaga crocea TaxID=2716225 RepID=A0A6G8ID88_9BURK|nr:MULTISPECIES: helix-turn-helix transcriptional regulator [Hydrogenophaga]MBL0942861.1 helix-turn-helix transcriptional regulator [Hydrogenophaga sp.]QIM51154.1 helix-turn-helix transcriptional regulator [Hydrogenophaga crocea]
MKTLPDPAAAAVAVPTVEALTLALDAGVDLGVRWNPGESLLAARSCLPFDGAWWGLGSWPAGGLPSLFLTNTVDLPAELVRWWHDCALQDRVAQTIVENTGAPMVWTDRDALAEPVRDWAQRFGLAQGVIASRLEPITGQVLFLAAYRSAATPAFGAADAELLDALARQAVLLWRSVRSQIEAIDRSMAVDRLAVVDASGRLSFCGVQAGQLLAEGCTDHDGMRWPPSLGAWLTDDPAGMHRRSGRLAGRIKRVPGGWWIEVGDARNAAVLPQRLLRVAELYARGLSSKQISKETGLSATTVRTYLQQAYGILGVSNKVSLGDTLGRGR